MAGRFGAPLWMTAIAVIVNIGLIGAARVIPTVPADAGAIYGNVTDQSQMPVPCAVIRVRNTMTHFNITATANEVGEYEVGNLRQGRYSLRAEAKDHEQVWICEIVVPAGERVRRDVVLRSVRPGRVLPTPVCPERDALMRYHLPH